MNNNNYSVGISYGFHDSAVCFIDQFGKIAFAAQEERFSRIKNESAFPILAIKRGLEYLKIETGHVTSIGYYEDSLKKIARICRTNPETSYSIISERLSTDPFFSQPSDACYRLFPNAAFCYAYPHHLSHAASSTFLSEHDDCVSIVIDGVGEFDSTSVWHLKGGTFKKVGSVQIPNSIGLLYAAITSFLDFEVNEGEYKVMGLASFGLPKYASRLREQVSFNQSLEEPYTISQEYFDLSGGSDLLYRESLSDLLSITPLRLPKGLTYDSLSKKDFQNYADLASSIQQVASEMVHHVFSLAKEAYPNSQLHYSGGVALNCAINKSLLDKYGNMYIQQASGDAGGALGAGMLAHHKFIQSYGSGNVDTFFSSDLFKQTTDKSSQYHTSYFGDSIESGACKSILEKSYTTIHEELTDSWDLINSAARDISRGKILGWVQGRMEWGPRALGARSILASPLGTDTQARINRAVKYRELFRPFAPVMLASYFEEFTGIMEAPYLCYRFMLSVVDVPNISREKYPACVHVDMTSRIQLVEDYSSEPIANLLRCLPNHGHPPILLNTSFNLKGEPIVCTAEQALGTFLYSDLDILYCDAYRVTRKE